MWFWFMPNEAVWWMQERIGWKGAIIATLWLECFLWLGVLRLYFQIT